jgi:hypothetical protein
LALSSSCSRLAAACMRLAYQPADGTAAAARRVAAYCKPPAHEI